MAEEYKRKWHEHHDPRADDKQYIGTKILDAIEKAAIDTYQDERTLEGWEWLNPISVGTAGAIRTVEGVGTVLANTPLVSQGLQAYGKVADVAAGNVGSLVATTGLDPRFGGWAVRLGEAWYGGQAISAASKSKYARAAGKFAKIQADEVGMKASMMMKKKHGKFYKNPKPGQPVRDPNAPPDLEVGRGPNKKTYERFAKRTYYPTEPLRDLWEIQIQSKSKFPTDLDRMREGLPPLRQRLMDDIDGNQRYQSPEPMWGPPNPQQTRNLSFLNDYNQTRLTVEQIAEDVVKVESKYRGAALQNPGGTITGNPVKSDITGRISGSPAVTQLGDNISPIRYTPKDFVMDDPNSIAGFIRGVNTKAKATFDFQNHHIASLAEYKRAVKNLSAGERQLGIAYLVEKGIMTGNNPLNRANIPIPVHQGVSNWITKNIRKYLKDNYPNLESLPLQERWKIFDELAELTRKSEEEMFKLVQQYNASIQGAPGNPGPELIAELFKDSELKNLKWFKQGMKRGDFDFESAGMGASGLEARTKIPKGPLPTKTEEMFKTPKSHLPGGGN